jgi:hypothetical protein
MEDTDSGADFDFFKTLPIPTTDTGPKDMAILTNYFDPPGSGGESDGFFANFRWVTLGICVVVAIVVLNPWLVSWVKKEKGVNKWLVYAAQIIVFLVVLVFLCQ